MKSMRYLGIDYGAKRIGVALSDEEGLFAFPFEVLENEPQALESAADLCAEKRVEMIVAGLSLNYRGGENPIMRHARAFAEKLAEKTNLSVVFEPEFLSTAEAERVVAHDNPMLDASAAAIILQSHIDRKKYKARSIKHET